MRVFRLDAHLVVHGAPQSLLAPKVTFGGLDRDVSQQELDLLQFTAGVVTQPGAGPAAMPHAA
jgi:hypothetical protein